MSLSNNWCTCAAMNKFCFLPRAQFNCCWATILSWYIDGVIATADILFLVIGRTFGMSSRDSMIVAATSRLSTSTREATEYFMGDLMLYKRTSGASSRVLQMFCNQRVYEARKGEVNSISTAFVRHTQIDPSATWLPLARLSPFTPTSWGLTGG